MIGAIETAIIEHLTAASKAGVLGYGYKAVDSLPIDFDDRLTEYLQKFPAAWTVPGEIRAVDELTNGRTIVEQDVGLVVAAQDLRSEKMNRHGDGAGQPGSYQMAIDACGLLLAQSLGLPIGGFSLVGMTPVYLGGDVLKKVSCALHVVRLRTRYTFDPACDPKVRGRRGLEDFTWFNAVWESPAAGEDDDQLAEDKVTLPAQES